MTRSSRPPVAIYSALADATRCRIVEILLTGPIPVHRLADSFSISRPAISRHLRVLKTAGLVAEVKKGRENVYALRAAKLAPAAAWIGKVLAPASAESQAPDAAPEPTPPTPVVSPVPQRAEAVAIQLPEALVNQPAAVSPAGAKAEKPVRPPKVETAVNQMGFDF